MSDAYVGTPFEVLKKDGATGYTENYIAYSLLNNKEFRRSTVSQLIEIDLPFGANIDDIVSELWEPLKTIDNGKLLDEIQDKNPTTYIRANKILRQEIGHSYYGGTYESIRSKKWNFDGYSQLWAKRNFCDLLRYGWS